MPYLCFFCGDDPYFLCHHDREIMQMLYLATMRFSALILWLRMDW